MDQKFVEPLNWGLKELQEIQKNLNNQKAEILKEVLLKIGGNQASIDEISKNGLPKQVFVSSDVPQVVITRLSFFCPVVIHEWLQQSSIVFVWRDDNLDLSTDINFLSDESI